ncbi:MAG: NADH-quinone oxidoreductase subunit NuoF [Woeseiaceae bacterium]|nr:NADH-quinone oxidoreductase subunit NuoF [Woeseiaceae bacterium]
MTAPRVYVPRETSAVSVGADEVALEIAREAKKAGSRIRLVRNGSWGASWLEPLVEVEADGRRIAYGNVGPADVPGLVAAGLFAGTAQDKCLGPVDEIPYLANQERWTFFRCGLIEPLSLEDFRARKGFAALEKAFEIGPAAVIDAVKASGLRGRGGAAFPTGIKWQTVADAKGAQKYVAVNADEGDSGTFSDRMLMEGDPYCLLESMAIAGYAVGANRGYIYLRSEYPLAHRVLTKGIEFAREAGWLGADIRGSGFDFDVELHLGAGSYVCGEETAMLESLEGKAGIVRYKPPLPAIQGLFGKPTVVNNVVTIASVPNILLMGGERYAKFGVNRSKGTLAFQLAGNIRRGGLVEKGFGVTIRELIEDFGGGTASGRPLKAVQLGGPLGAFLTDEQLDTPLDYEAIVEAGGMIGHGGLVVFDDTANMAEQARFAMEFCAIESCGKCTPCRIGSTRGVEVIDRMIAGENREENYDLLVELCDTMEGASLCAMGGMTPYPVRSVLQHFAEDFATARRADQSTR